MFDTEEPWRTRDNMFLLFDFVHLLKNIRNNWITEATPEFEKKLSTDIISSLVHIAGYVMRNDDTSDLDDTYYYHEKHGNYFDKLNRGGLCKPGDNAVQFTIYAYIAFHAVVNHVCRKHRYI